jgi:inorganic pyrophosphatase
MAQRPRLTLTSPQFLSDGEKGFQRAPRLEAPIDWTRWEKLLRERGVTIDRPRGSAHPRYPSMIYQLDYGFIPGTVGGDGAEVDVFIGSAPTGLRAALLTSDSVKGDREIKLLWNMTPSEIEITRAFLSGGAMTVELVWREEI